MRLALEKPEPEVAETVEIIDREVNSCERIVGNLLDYARPWVTSRAKVDLKQLIESALVSASVPPHIEVSVEVQPGLPLVLGDPDQIHQVLVVDDQQGTCVTFQNILLRRGSQVRIALSGEQA